MVSIQNARHCASVFGEMKLQIQLLGVLKDRLAKLVNSILNDMAEYAIAALYSSVDAEKSSRVHKNVFALVPLHVGVKPESA
jgi:hypothetical protein